MNKEDTAGRWLAEEETVLANAKRGSGLATPEQMAERSGLEMLSAMMSGEWPRAPMSETLDFLLVHVSHGHAVFQGHPRREHYNPLGVVHGGWAATLLDSAMGCAVQTTLPRGRGYTTMELKVNLVRPITDSVQVVRAEGRTIHVGRTSATAEARLVGPDGKLYAHATTTCMIFDRPVA